MCASCALLLQLGAHDAAQTARAGELAAAGRLDEAIATAREVDRAPSDLRARLLEARALAVAGRTAQADRAYAQVAARDPNNWLVHYEWARATFRHDLDASIERLRRAKELNPLLPVPEDLG